MWDGSGCLHGAALLLARNRGSQSGRSRLHLMRFARSVQTRRAWLALVYRRCVAVYRRCVGRVFDRSLRTLRLFSLHSQSPIASRNVSWQERLHAARPAFAIARSAGRTGRTCRHPPVLAASRRRPSLRDRRGWGPQPPGLSSAAPPFPGSRGGYSPHHAARLVVQHTTPRSAKNRTTTLTAESSFVGKPLRRRRPSRCSRCSGLVMAFIERWVYDNADRVFHGGTPSAPNQCLIDETPQCHSARSHHASAQSVDWWSVAEWVEPLLDSAGSWPTTGMRRPSS